MDYQYPQNDLVKFKLRAKLDCLGARSCSCVRVRCVRVFVRFCVRVFVCSFLCSCVRSCVRVFVCSFLCSCVRSCLRVCGFAIACVCSSLCSCVMVCARVRVCSRLCKEQNEEMFFKRISLEQS